MSAKEESAGATALPRGTALLREPLLNKGTAFNAAERDAFGLRGLLPPRINSQADQVRRVLENFRRKPTDLDKYINLAALHDRNETLFYRVVVDNPDEMMPIIYTPTVGLACQQFGHIFQRPRGLFVSIEDLGRVESVLRNWPHRDVAMIVVTDGERILGLGDQGADGMGIPVGKLSLYTACAGVHPRQCLPVVLDVGTNNAALLEDPLYIGLPQHRVRGEAYDALLDEFIAATQVVFPGVVVQFEDFANQNAFRLLQKWRDRICTFNDDIQGTAAVALAGIVSALRISGGRLGEQRLLFLGAGEAATGIADLAVTAMVAEGLTPAAARARCWLFDSRGLVHDGRSDLVEHKRPYAHPHAPVTVFADAVRALRPTAIIGVAASAGAFTEEVVREMSAINKRPIVFALSNPTSKAECTAEQAYRWSGGQALFASGSPFGPVTLDGRRFVPRQGNNSYIFPGVGLGAITTRARRVTDEMFMAAVRALCAQVTPEDLAQGSLFPPLAQVREVSAHIAAAVAQVVFDQGLAGVPRPADLLVHVRSQMYEPSYADYTQGRA
ncbi:MAG: NAD-dependent malic enzyme [Rubrivivax sp.]|jgi:malate dehydrogenase (oxaloacetate-decarboxylating)(NADP+)|nr:NAD-dependent malic enzyme [Betaproteobacteria bacterium]MBK8104848.1 NAD-dependent malic enzyme [Betaproteobacteria bacterium]MBK8863641.1 NAD-dependent malic enzyme [Betaproteobacteria bacterium]MBP6316808.1 NAD-dependent malic enzyme [Rubrivivax sp.]MBP9908496.1 NAD-dependent malic enzyme [Rubrivivax sp.]